MRILYGFINPESIARYVANNYINVFPANTFFNDAYQTISDIQFIATGRVAPVTGYKYIYLYHSYFGNSHVIKVIISLLNFLRI